MTANAINLKLIGYTTLMRLWLLGNTQSGRYDLTLDLGQNPPNGAHVIRAVFLGVHGLSLHDIGGGVTQFLCLRVEDIGAYQLDRIRLRVRDLERGNIMFDCLSASIGDAASSDEDTT
jgi:hypothetical protein